MLGNRNAQHSFSKTPDVKIGRSQFDRSSTLKDTFDFDYLIPIFCDEIIPGDTMNVNVASFARLATPLVPIMDNMYLDFFFFFVPNRLTFANWEKLNGAQDNPGDSTDFILPQMTITAAAAKVQTIYDKFGLPVEIANNYTLKNTLPLRCYNRIWNDWFRDENLQTQIINNTDNGPDDVSDYTLKKRGKRHDYFTSALPTPQKGAAVSLPLGTSALVKRTDSAAGLIQFKVAGSNTNAATANTLTTSASSNLNSSPAGANLNFDPNGSLYADLSTATAATINQLRQAFMMQSLFERDMRGGTRYVEILKSHFGVVSPDFRLQRSEYLGGGSVTINSHPVAQTAPTSGSNPQGQLAAFATASSSLSDGIGFSKSFVEHGYVIGMVCARADLTYQQGLDKMWNRSTRYDFFWPELQGLGEQAVLTKEIYLQGTAADETVFGYQERYAEYRYKPSQIHGKFRSQYSTNLDQWHLAQEFGSTPVLNSTFIEQNTPIARAIAVPSEPHLLLDVWFKTKHARPMLTYSTPAKLGGF